MRIYSYQLVKEVSKFIRTKVFQFSQNGPLGDLRSGHIRIPPDIFAAKLLTKHTQLTFPRAVTPSLSLLTLRQKEKGLFHDETCGDMGYTNHMSEPFVNPPMLGEGQN